jgi:hypothetical protein
MDDSQAYPLKATEKLKIFYQAPAVKFASHVVSDNLLLFSSFDQYFVFFSQMMYVVFVVLYCYMLLFSFQLSITTIEWVVLAWMATLLVEEIREVGTPTWCTFLIRK